MGQNGAWQGVTVSDDWDLAAWNGWVRGQHLGRRSGFAFTPFVFLMMMVMDGVDLATREGFVAEDWLFMHGVDICMSVVQMMRSAARKYKMKYSTVLPIYP